MTFAATRVYFNKANQLTRWREPEATFSRWPLLFIAEGQWVRCWVYVDGFNFYHGAAKRTGHKWVNLLELSRRLRKHDTIERIKYFTALVERRTDDPGQRQRQQTYWRALDTLGCVERIEGHFSRWPRYMPLDWSIRALEAHAAQGYDVVGVRPTMVRVLRSEEKGSDVNLAVHLVNDAHQTSPGSTFEVALIISTDADLAGAIGIVTKQINKPVHVCKPDRTAKTRLLHRAATTIFGLSPSVLRASLFPPTLTDTRGSFQWDVRPAKARHRHVRRPRCDSQNY